METWEGWVCGRGGQLGLKSQHTSSCCNS